MQIINNDVFVNGVLNTSYVGKDLEKEIDRIAADRLETVVRLLSEKTAIFDEKIQRVQDQLTSIKESLLAAAEKYNAAIEVINDMQRRVRALEANYDPTIIK